MASRRQFGFGMGSLNVGSFEPNQLVCGEPCRGGSWSFSFHDFSGYLESCRYFSPYLVQGFKTFFDSRNVCGEIDRGNEFWLEPVPDLERGFPCGTMCSDVVGEFGEWEEVGPIILLEVAEYSEELFNFLVDAFCFSICLRVEGR